MKKKLLTLLFLIISVFSFAESKAVNSKGLIIGELSNGMKYYIYKNEMPKNRVNVNVLVRAGSLQEDEDQQGMAHLIEHLCFNGTEKYDKNEVIKYYQSIGMNFGGDLNAHTSFSETVYKIQIPTTNKETFEKGIEVLEEMTFKPTFKQEEIDSEKYIVQEEWRLSQGLSGRITKFFQESLFADSRYGERFPIGKMDIVLGSKRDVIKRFYDKWYHPKNMAVVMVGDIDPKYAKKVIEKYFDVKTDRKYTPRPEYKLNEVSENKYLVFKDKELPYVMLNISNVVDIDRLNVREYFKDLIFTGVLQDRFARKIKDGKSSLMGGGFYGSKYGDQQMNTCYAILSKGDIEKGIKETVEVLKGLTVNKVTKEEINAQKKKIKTVLEQSVKNRDSITSGKLIRIIDEVFLDGEVFVDSADALKGYNEVGSKITKNEINEMGKKFYNSKKISLLFAPENEGVKVPDGKEFEKIIENQEKKGVKKARKINYNLKLEKPELVTGFINSEKNLKNCKKFTLSNGIEFLYKKTDFEKDKIYITLSKEEGSLYDPYHRFINSKFTDVITMSGAGNIGYEDVESFAAGKSFTGDTYISTFNQGMIIKTSRKDLNLSLDYMRYLLLEPKISDKAYDYVLRTTKDDLENQMNSPRRAYHDKIVEKFFRNNLKKRALNLDDLEVVDKRDIMKEYKRKFSNFYGFKGVILGSIDEKEAREILENYFAGLPSETIKKSCGREWLDIKYPEGVTSSKVVMGTDKKVNVSLYYPIHKRYFGEDGYKVNMFVDILKMQLTEEVREKLGGVYGVGVAAKYTHHERPFMQIHFATDPARAKEISTAIKKEVAKLAKGEIKDEFLESLIKNYKLTYESEQDKNGYWLFYLDKKLERGDNWEPYSPERFRKEMTKENLKEFFKGMVGNDNYTEIKLIPRIEG